MTDNARQGRTEAVQVPVERSGAACPTGAVAVRRLGVDIQDFWKKSDGFRS